MLNALFLLFLSAPLCFAGRLELYKSGLLKEWDQRSTDFVESESAFDIFLTEHFHFPGYEWRVVNSFQDNTHIHRLYALYYQGVRVFEKFLKLHYSKAQMSIAFASSNLEKRFERVLGAHRRSDLSFFRTEWFPDRQIRLNADPIYIPTHEERDILSAYEVRVPNQRGASIRHFVADATTGEVLIEKRVGRHLTIGKVPVWPISPFNTTNTKAPDSVDLTDLLETNKLKSSNIYVRRVQDYATPILKDVDPDPSISIDFSSDPAAYDQKCTGSATQCPNQRTDGINVYYHISNYRSTLSKYLSDLGMENPTLSKEPLDIFINAFNFPIGGKTDQTNNAAYVSDGCYDLDDGTRIERCMIFLRPEPLTSSACGNASKFYDLAREAIVIVHEYQHFITDVITQMVPGEINLANVGDALHEGYSDYFGISQTSRISSSSATLVGEYAFQNCKYYQREIGTLRKYENGEAEKDPHVSGQSWASGLWQLRKELGEGKADKLAFKSLYFLTPKPGFAESVEALVKADEALNSGENAGRIRQLFYDEIAWLGGMAGVYRDSSRGIANVGFRSCASVRPQGSPWGSGALVSIFLCGIVFVGRRWGWQRNRS